MCHVIYIIIYVCVCVMLCIINSGKKRSCMFMSFALLKTVYQQRQHPKPGGASAVKRLDLLKVSPKPKSSAKP